MLSAKKPFDDIHHKNAHMQLVVLKGCRPKVDEVWGPSLTGFLKSCWHQDLTKRPSAPHASAVLKREVAKFADGGGDLVLNNFRRKSTFVNRNALREKFQGRKSKSSSHALKTMPSIEEDSKPEARKEELDATRPSHLRLASPPASKPEATGKEESAVGEVREGFASVTVSQ